jgi:hypothetical protein
MRTKTETRTYEWYGETITVYPDGSAEAMGKGFNDEFTAKNAVKRAKNMAEIDFSIADALRSPTTYGKVPAGGKKKIILGHEVHCAPDGRCHIDVYERSFPSEAAATEWLKAHIEEEKKESAVSELDDAKEGFGAVMAMSRQDLFGGISMSRQDLFGALNSVDLGDEMEYGDLGSEDLADELAYGAIGSEDLAAELAYGAIGSEDLAAELQYGALGSLSLTQQLRYGGAGASGDTRTTSAKRLGRKKYR